MSGFSTDTIDNLIRTDIWTPDLKEIFEFELMGLKYVKLITDRFPDGDRYNIPSIGQMETQDYAEGQPIKYTAMDTGNYQFTINKYKSSGTFISDKMKQDSMWSPELVGSFVPKMNRALAVAMETDLLSKGNAGQTASDPNTINDGRHRFVGGGSGNTISVNDFAKAKFALEKAAVPMTNLIAIVDPSVVFTLATQTNIVNLLTPNPQWGRIVSENYSTGMRFSVNVFGFDVYTSAYLPKGISETVSSVAVTNGVANYFFSAAPDAVPLIGAIRQPPRVEQERNKDLQRDEFVVTARWGFDLYREENMVVCLTDTSTVYS